MFSLDYDSLGHLVSASIQGMLLEKSRVIRRPEGEPTFNIFYQMLAGLDSSSKREFSLENLNEPNLFLTPLQRMEDKTKASVMFNKITNVAFKVLNVSSAESHAIFSTLASIYHLGVASVTKGNMNRTTFARPQAASRAAQCLGKFYCFNPEEIKFLVHITILIVIGREFLLYKLILIFLTFFYHNIMKNSKLDRDM